MQQIFTFLKNIFYTLSYVFLFLSNYESYREKSLNGEILKQSTAHFRDYIKVCQCPIPLNLAYCSIYWRGRIIL